MSSLLNAHSPKSSLCFSEVLWLFQRDKHLRQKSISWQRVSDEWVCCSLIGLAVSERTSLAFGTDHVWARLPEASP